jgi:hypothetical protein
MKPNMSCIILVLHQDKTKFKSTFTLKDSKFLSQTPPPTTNFWYVLRPPLIRRPGPEKFYMKNLQPGARHTGNP